MTHSPTPAAPIVPELLRPREAAELLGIGERTLWRHSRCGIAPRPVAVGGTTRYVRAETMEGNTDAK